MADEHEESSGSPWRDLIVFILGLIALILVWLVVGGSSKQSLRSILLTPSPLANFGATSTNAAPHNYLPFWNPSGASSTSANPEIPGSEPVIINQYSGAYASDPEQEYLVLYANSTNSGPIDISGWRLSSSRSGRSATIPGAVPTPTLGQVQSPVPVLLQPGDVAIVTSGRSPIGYSFEENSCSGYLAQNQQFFPDLSSSCPFPQNELLSRPDLGSDQSCVQAVASLQPCQTVLYVPSGASPQCADFISQHFTYNGCVATHRGDHDFLTGRWRLYLGYTGELWNNGGDTINLIDGSGRIVSTVNY